MSGTIERFGLPMFDTLLTMQRSYFDTLMRAADPATRNGRHLADRSDTMNWMTNSVYTRSMAPLQAATQLATDVLRRYGEMTQMFWSETASTNRQIAARSTAVSAAGESKIGEQVLPLGQERINIGKQVVEGARTRVRRYVVETPVEEDVELLTNTVVVDRRKPQHHSGDVLTDEVLELANTYERPVISKGVEMVEELVLRHETTAHVERIHETLKRDEVAIDEPSKLPAVVAARHMVKRDEVTTQAHDERHEQQKEATQKATMSKD